jgi:fructose-1,6-bisphosphatase/inositol monophosphatase family enzyme
VAAGAPLVEEVGGVVTDDWSGGPGYLGGDILSGSPATHALLVTAATSAEAEAEAENRER